jgi:adenine/guanine phosphoribosyltransferase-like PRPP-binding protein
METLGAEIVELAFVIELAFLHGRDTLSKYPLFSLIEY